MPRPRWLALIVHKALHVPGRGDWRSPLEQLPACALTLSSKVKQTRCGYSLSAITTPASPSFRTYTWHRYSGKDIPVREAAKVPSLPQHPPLST